jgi:hypothetical protein
MIDVATEGHASTVPGHKSALAFGLLGPGDGVPVVVMLGRVRTLNDQDECLKN